MSKHRTVRLRPNVTCKVLETREISKLKFETEEMKIAFYVSTNPLSRYSKTAYNSKMYYHSGKPSCTHMSCCILHRIIYNVRIKHIVSVYLRHDKNTINGNYYFFYILYNIMQKIPPSCCSSIHKSKK